MALVKREFYKSFNMEECEKAKNQDGAQQKAGRLRRLLLAGESSNDRWEGSTDVGKGGNNRVRGRNNEILAIKSMGCLSQR